MESQRNLGAVKRVRHHIINKDYEVKERNDQALQLIDRMLESKESYKYLIEAAEKAGVFTRKKHSR